MTQRPPSDQLLASYLSGECSEQELREVELWLNSHPEYRDVLPDMEKVWRPAKRRPHLWNKTRLWLKIREAAGVQQVPVIRESHVPAAIAARQSRLVLSVAGIMLAVSIGLFSYLVTTGNNLGWSPMTLTVQNGTQERLTLDDGTVVILDAGSSFSYPNEFTAFTREVRLYGEGYFEVAPDESRPFMVRTDYGVVQVLGTRFAVRSWELDRAVRVVVAEGRVSLRPVNHRRSDAVVVMGGQAAGVLEDGTLQSPQDVDPGRYLGWLHHDLEFDNVSLEEILFYLERWYDVEFVLEEPHLAAERLSLHTQQKTIEGVLEMIALLTDLQVERDNSTIRLFTAEPITSGK